MKRLLIIGASVLQLPAIKKAKEMGLYVGVVDFNPQAIGIPFADEYFNVSTVDDKGVYEAAKIFRADGIVTLATDMPMRAVAYTCERLGLVGIDYATAIKATDKGEMSRSFEENGIEHPWFRVLDHEYDIMQDITFPCVTKPTDSAGSRGVMLVNSCDELEAAIEYSSKNGRSGKVVIEEYMQGMEVSVEVMVIEGIPHVLQITDKLTTGAPHFVETGHSQPSQLPDLVQKSISDLAKRAVIAIGITNGPAHVEIMVTADGPKMIELGARLGGDCIATHLVPLSTGIDLVKATIDLILGTKPDLISKYSKGAAIRFLLPPTQIEQSDLEKVENIAGVQEVYFDGTANDGNRKFSNSTDRIGYIITQGETVEQAVQICDNAIQEITQ